MSVHRLKITAVLVAVVLLTSFLAITGIIWNLETGMEELADAPPGDIDLTTVSDGTYAGSYQVFPISAEVTVTIQGGQMTDIHLTRHDHGRGGPAEAITRRVMATQRLTVDAVSGATYSSMVILRAIEDALLRAAR